MLTSTANAYANIIIAYVQDCLKQQSYNPLEPFYIIELGAGSGMFSFYTIKSLLRLQQELGLTAVKFVYVMTDIAEKNIEFWSEHPALKDYVTTGILDFGLFNMECDQQIGLRNSNVILSHEKQGRHYRNPMIVLANYVFDTVTQDMFHIKDRQLYEGLVTLARRQDVPLNEQPASFKDLTAKFSYRPVDTNYYRDPEFNAVLNYYVNHSNESYVLFPVGGLNGLRNLAELANNKLLLLTTDKGYSSHFNTYSRFEPQIINHGSFSLSVNFDAIGRYVSYRHGDYYHQSQQQDILSCAYLPETKFSYFPETKRALHTHFEQFSPGNLFTAYKHHLATQKQADLRTILAHLAYTNWDVQFFDGCYEWISLKSRNADEATLYDLVSGLQKLDEHYYYMPNNRPTLFNISYLLQVVGKHEDAIKSYRKVLRYFNQQQDAAYNNIGICYYTLRRYQQAEQAFKAALSINPDNILTHGWLAKLKKILA